MKKIVAVARWEYIEKVKSKAFLISLVLMPVIMLGFGLLPTILAGRADTEVRIIGIIDLTGELDKPLAERMEKRYKLPDGQPNYVFRHIDHQPNLAAAQQFADQLVLDKQIRGYLIITQEVFRTKSAEFRSTNLGMVRMFERIATNLRDVLLERELQAAGLDRSLVAEFGRPVELKTIKLTAAGEREEGFESAFASVYIFMMMMFVLVVTSGQLLVRSVVEEKSNRIVEVLVSSCSSTELMSGKILGLSGLGFTQLGVWGLIAAAISLKLGVTLISIPAAVLLLVFFVLGYLLYAAIFVALGSPLSTEQEAQQVTSYLVLILILPVVLAIPVLENPDQPMVHILTYIPLMTPTMMAMRIPLQMPAAGEIVAAIGVLALSVGLAMWIAGKIFRTAILAYGKRPTVRELIQLLRTAR